MEIRPFYRKIEAKVSMDHSSANIFGEDSLMGISQFTSSIMNPIFPLSPIFCSLVVVLCTGTTSLRNCRYPAATVSSKVTKEGGKFCQRDSASSHLVWVPISLQKEMFQVPSQLSKVSPVKVRGLNWRFE